MAAVTAYPDIVQQVLDAYTKVPYAHGDLACEAIFDRQRNRYVLMTVGWDDEERVHHPLAHIDILDGKIWVQTDNTEHGLAPEFVRAGVPKSDIVLAFRPADVRKHTEYAVA
ncbi:MAG TPA: XisI protein [Gemmataceae bacterium]|nr:XisI protein [Gemmataceae bacterium]